MRNFALNKIRNIMLTAERIKEYALLGEGYTVDFKVTVPSKVRELTEEVCSFANASGGYILIGVDNNNKIVGSHVDNNKRSSIQGSIGEISPALHCVIYPVQVDSVTVWVIEVPSGINKPYSFGGCIYMREGANSQKITNIEEIREFFQHSGKVYFDATPYANYDLIGNIDEGIIERFRSEAGISKAIDDIQMLDNLQCFDITDQPKQGSILFFAKHPEKIFFHAITRCVRYKGVDKTYIIDDKTFCGPLLTQYQGTMDWIKSCLSISYDINGIGSREEKWEIPLGVFRESLVNSLSHRDYNEQGAFTMVELFDDRVEVSNPGGLLPQVMNNFGRKSLSRNPFIFGLFMRMRMVEHVGSGINRMCDLMKRAGLPQPIFETEGFFTVTFKRQPEYVITPEQQRILDAFHDNPHVKVEELCLMLGKGKSYVYKNIKKLKEIGKLL